MHRRGLLRFLPGLTLSLFLAPVIAGLIGTWLPAFGYFPSLGGDSFSLAPWTALFAQPGIADSLRLTLLSGFLATVAAFHATPGARELLDVVLLEHPPRALGNRRALWDREVRVRQRLRMRQRGGRGRHHRVVGVLVQRPERVLDLELGQIEEVERGRLVPLELGARLTLLDVVIEA